MTVVFNLWAVLVAIVVALILMPLDALFPGLVMGDEGTLVIAFVALLVSVAGDLIGARSRLFYLPVWFWSLIVLGVGLYDFWGWWGPASVGVLIFGGIAALAAWTRKTEQDAWARAPQELAIARSLAERPHAREECFEHLHKAFIAPRVMTQTREMWMHQRAVLAVAHKLLDNGRVAPGKEDLVPKLDRAYADKLQNPKARVRYALAREVQELIEHQGVPA